MKTWTPEEVREFRLANGLTLKKLGEMVGVGVSEVHKWEKGIANPSKTSKILLTRIEADFSKPKKGGKPR